MFKFNNELVLQQTYLNIVLLKNIKELSEVAKNLYTASRRASARVCTIIFLLT